jgi:hypothetical protein
MAWQKMMLEAENSEVSLSRVLRDALEQGLTIPRPVQRHSQQVRPTTVVFGSDLDIGP